MERRHTEYEEEWERRRMRRKWGKCSGSLDEGEDDVVKEAEGGFEILTCSNYSLNLLTYNQIGKQLKPQYFSHRPRNQTTFYDIFTIIQI